MFIPSWQIAKSLPLKSKDGDITAEKRVNVNTGGTASKPDVEIKVDGAEEGKEEELLSTVSWDQPKRLVNLSSNNYHEILFRFSWCVQATSGHDHSSANGAQQTLHAHISWV